MFQMKHEYLIGDENMDQKNWNYNADVIIVGSGAAGYSAAITARSNGLEVLMIEKASLIGGTTGRSGGGFWIPNNRLQEEEGIVDSKDDAVRYMARLSFPQLYNPDDAHLGLPDREFELLSTYYDMGSKAIDFMEEQGALNIVPQFNWIGTLQVDYMDHLFENKDIRSYFLSPPEPL